MQVHLSAGQGLDMVCDISEVLSLVQRYGDLSPDRILLSNVVSTEASVRRAVASQVAVKSVLARKLPSWPKMGVYIPKAVNLEQASSEATAGYKQNFVKKYDALLDLTGGMGVDFWAMASVCRSAVYVEQDEELFTAASYNLSRLLPQQKCQCYQANSMDILEELVTEHRPSLIYVDPARRANIQAGQRVYAIEDCSPSLYEIVQRLERLLPLPMPRLLVKLSPMLDIKHCLNSLTYLQSITVLAHRGEVKELVLELCLDKANLSPECVPLRAVDILSSGSSQCFEGVYQDESILCSLAKQTARYLYEPNAAVMKIGLFNYVGRYFALEKLHQHSHLYTSEEYIADFPGRVFAIKEVMPYTSKLIKRINKQIGGAQITCRNFPLNSDKLRQKLQLKDCSDITLFATTLWDNSLVLLHCERI